VAVQLHSSRRQQCRSSGDTIFLAGGNWRLDTRDATYVAINKAITLVGAGSGNSFDAYGHINNASGTTMCPTAGTSITCVYQTGPSYELGAIPTPAGFIRFGLDGVGLGAATNCVNETISHIFFDGSTTTAGGDYLGILAIQSCAGPVTLADIRVLTFGKFSAQSRDTAFRDAIAECSHSRQHARGTIVWWDL
jgi:hypothetical protein